MSDSTHSSRRKFLGEAPCALIGSTSLISSLLSLKLVNQAAASNMGAGDDRKTIVSIMLAGGCDTFNLLVPNSTGGHAEYATSRGGVGDDGVALDRDSLIGLTGGGDGYGLHPSCQGLADLFNGSDAKGRRLSFVTNVGTLLRPTTRSQYQSGNHLVPRALFSHIDQIRQWQTSQPESLNQLSGWAGRMADLLHSEYNTQATSMSISLSGNNVFQIGDDTSQFSITSSGALLPSGGNSTIDTLKNQALDNLAAQSYRNLMRNSLAEHTKESIEAQRAFGVAYNQVDSTVARNIFGTALLNRSPFARKLLSAAITIKAREDLGLRRSTIFIQRGGWDHHNELLAAHSGMLEELSDSLKAFQLSLEALGVDENVLTYTSSDFGRSLRTNGRGTDHAWGGNQLVMGTPVDGGKLVGTFPSLVLEGADDAGKGGRMIPTTSTDEFFAEIASWFGVCPADMAAVLPNLSEFHDITSNPRPLGFIKEGLIDVT